MTAQPGPDHPVTEDVAPPVSASSSDDRAAAKQLFERFQPGEMSEKFALGFTRQAQLDPKLPETIQGALAAVAPDFGRIIVEFVFGDIYARPGLDFKHRVLATLAAVTALNQLFAVEEYVRFALNQGFTRTEIVEVIMQMAVYAGMGPAMEGLATAKKVFDEQDGGQ